MSKNLLTHVVVYTSNFRFEDILTLKFNNALYVVTCMHACCVEFANVQCVLNYK